MKAIVAREYGGPEVLRVSEHVPQPEPEKGQLSIEVYAAGVNPFDLHLLSGAMQKKIPLKFPVTPGGDLAGVVRGVGEDVHTFKSGDEVYGTAITLSGGSGSYAEYAVVVSKKLALKPKSVSFSEAAALPVAGLTAAEALLDNMKLEKGQKILIHGGAGGVGHYAIQLAKSLGAYIATTASAGDIDFVTSLGADETFDYSSQDFSALAKDFDAVLDVVGGDVNKKSYRVLKPGGILVTTKGQSDEELENKYKVTTVKQNTNTDGPALERLATLVDEGKLKPHIDSVYPLEDSGKAFVHLKSGHPKGKVVIRIKE